MGKEVLFVLFSIPVTLGCTGAKLDKETRRHSITAIGNNLFIA
jgi:hypothetical protein